MIVTPDMLEAVMDKEEREKYLPALRKELALSHVLRRQAERLRSEQAENDRKIASLKLLTGGMGNARNNPKVTYFDFQKDMQAYLLKNYMHSDPKIVPAIFARQFAKEVFEKHPVSNEQRDQYAEATVDVVEAYANPDPVSFWLWAKFNGDYKTMINAWAEELGFVKYD